MRYVGIGIASHCIVFSTRSEKQSTTTAHSECLLDFDGVDIRARGIVGVLLLRTHDPIGSVVEVVSVSLLVLQDSRLIFQIDAVDALTADLGLFCQPV